MKSASSYKRLLLVLVSVCVCAGVFHVAASRRKSASGNIVISQIYGGGGNSGATLKNDYLELFNPTSATVDVSNWSIQYASSTGTNWQVTNLCANAPCTIAAGRYFLIQQAQGSGGSASLPSPDAIGTISMSA